MRSLSKLALAAVLIAGATPVLAQSATIVVEQPWARATPAGAKTGDAYMTIVNKSGSPDRLTGASSAAAGTLQIHEMSVVNGVMRMRELPQGLAIPANGTVVLKPGSYHVMLMGLKKPFTAGGSFPLTLAFAKAGNISVTVPIQAMGTGQPNGGGMGNMGNMQGGGMGHMEMK